LSCLNNKFKKRDCEGNKQFQDRWAKSIVDDRGKVHQVQCAICLKIEGKERLLVPKLNKLFKHASRFKAKVPNRGVEVGVEVGFFYFNPKN
jgi:hypothetical protein